MARMDLEEKVTVAYIIILGVFLSFLLVGSLSKRIVEANEFEDNYYTKVTITSPGNEVFWVNVERFSTTADSIDILYPQVAGTNWSLNWADNDGTVWGINWENKEWINWAE